MKYKMPVISRCISYKWWLLIFIFLITVKVGTFGNSIAVAETYEVWGNFTNTLKLPPQTNPSVEESTSATFFGGHVLMSPDSFGNLVELTDGTYRLERSSFGEIVITKPAIASTNTSEKISGTVVDKSDVPVYNAKVKIQGGSIKDKAKTDVNGYFEFPNLEKGTYKIKAKKNGYKKSKWNVVTLEDNEQMEIKLLLEKNK